MSELVAELRRHRVVDATVDVGRRMAVEWKDDRVTGLAAELAFFAILTVFPAVLAVASLLASLGGIVGEEDAARAQEVVINLLRQVLTEDSQVVAAVERLFAESQGSLLTAGALLSLVALSRGFAAVVRALDVVYDLPEARSWIATRLLGVALALGSLLVATAMLAMLVLGPLLGGGRQLADIIGLGNLFATFWDVLRTPFAIALLVAWATTLFHFAPDHHTPWRRDLPGGILTAALWVVVSLGFRLYVVLAPRGEVAGVLSGGLTLIVWLWLLAMALLIGGELNAILVERAEGRSPAPPGAGQPAPG